MKNMKKYLFLALAVCIARFGFAQTNVTFTRDYFYDREEQLAEALRQLQEGDKYYSEAEKRNPSPLVFDFSAEALYAAALPFYLDANIFNPNNADLNRRIAKCYLFVQREKALFYVQKAMSISLEVHPEMYLIQALASQSMMQFDQAVESYKQYKSRLSPQGYAKYAGLIEKHMAECAAAKKAIVEPQNVFVDNLGQKVNAGGSDFNPLFLQKEDQMIYTQEIFTPGTGKLAYNVLSAPKNKGVFADPQKTTFPEGYAVLYIAEDEDHALLYNPGKGKGDIFEVYRNADNTWRKPVSAGKNINHRKWDERTAYLSPEGNVMFFSSNRPGGYGGYDIYYATRDFRGKWSKPVNIGATINSEYDDHILYVSMSGTTLYFASQGHESIGGFDIFQASLENDAWGAVRNLGYPVNTPSDELSFYPAKHTAEFYISSNRIGSYGSFDVYRVISVNPNKQVVSNYEDNLLAYHSQRISEFVIESAVQVKGTEMVTLNGVVTNEQKNPVKAVISIFNTRTGIEVAQFESNAATGQFTLPVPVGSNYAMLVMAPGYMFQSQNINVPYGTRSRDLYRYVELLKMEVDKSVALRNVFFDFGQHIPTAASFKELNVLFQLMVDQPNIKVEISGHTDNRGSLQANQIMSERRAKAIVDFLIRNGIDPARLSYVGYGYERPIAPNTTVEGRSQNRRTEFKIISQ
jgi:outer membrane protein OmpA-like peptidoglycan-associated protein/tetratricopeptide (TPR) repeat protein